MTTRWNEECEELLAEWSEKASCYRWLHGRSEKKYKKQYYMFSIPVIILSTLTGAANVGMDSFVPTEKKAIAGAVVGGVNIFAGILSTLQNFLKVAELMESHRSSGVAWSKLGRNIAIELALDHKRRGIQNDFLKIARAEFDRLIESSPMIDDDIIRQFQNKFNNYKISIPSICNGLDKCEIYRVDKSLFDYTEDLLDGIDDLVSQEEKELLEKIKLKIKADKLLKFKQMEEHMAVESSKVEPSKVEPSKVEPSKVKTSHVKAVAVKVKATRVKPNISIPSDLKKPDTELTKLKPNDTELTELKSNDTELTELKSNDTELTEIKSNDTELTEIKSNDIEVIIDEQDSDVDANNSIDDNNSTDANNSIDDNSHSDDSNINNDEENQNEVNNIIDS
jgi:hypothetical protein